MFVTNKNVLKNTQVLGIHNVVVPLMITDLVFINFAKFYRETFELTVTGPCQACGFISLSN